MLSTLLNLPAFLFPLVLFGYWFIIGYATLSILHTQRCTIRNMTLAPAVGLSVIIVCIFNLSWFGLPVKTFAWPLCIILFITSLSILYYKKPLLPLRRYFPFFMIMLVALYITGRPLLEFGFSWFSYTNDDMLNYCLSVSQLLHHGYFGPPVVDAVKQGTDYASYMWVMSSPGTMRYGSELLLAWLTSLTHISPDRLFMPTMLGLHCTLLNTIGALIYSSNRKRRHAILGTCLYAVSALASLGVFYQLIGQVGGLTLLVIGATLLLKFFHFPTKSSFFRYALLCGIVLSALAIFYPELFLVLILSAMLYFIISIIKRRASIKIFILLGCLVLLELIFLLHSYLIYCFFTILDQSNHASISIALENSIFPFFLVPSGLADLWGLQSIMQVPPEPWLSITIAAGGILLIAISIFAFYQLWKKQSAASVVFVIFFMMAINFFYRNGDFALFKSSMYIQPFLWALFADFILEFAQYQLLSGGLLLLLVTSNLWFGEDYLSRSRGLNWDDVPHASKLDVATQLDTTFQSFPTKTAFLSDTTNTVLAKFEALHGKGYSLAFPGSNFFSQVVAHFSIHPDNYYRYWYFSHFSPKTIQESDAFLNTFNTTYQKQNFFFVNQSDTQTENDFFRLNTPSPASAQFLLKSSAEQSVFNRWNALPSSNSAVVQAIPIHQIHDHLIFINAELGQHYYLPANQGSVSLSRLEQDYFYPNQTFSGVSRYFLFNIVRPSQQPRLVLNISTTLNGDHVNQLPPAVVVGNQRYALDLVGNGSARVFSPIIVPKTIYQQDYIVLDMQKDGKRLNLSPRTGMMGLYGRNAFLDTRKVVGFARDISLISDEQYQSIKAPSLIKAFPADLNNPHLEYSGFYEDGWMGADAYLYLTPHAQKNRLTIQGTIPNELDKNILSIMTLLIDNKKVLEKTLASGYFNLSIPVELTLERHKITLHFSQFIHLAGIDGRVASARIEQIGFTGAP